MAELGPASAAVQQPSQVRFQAMVKSSLPACIEMEVAGVVFLPEKSDGSCDFLFWRNCYMHCAAMGHLC